jgi:hypothetical protein
MKFYDGARSSTLLIWLVLQTKNMILLIWWSAMTLGGCTKQRPLIVLRTLEQLNCSYTMPCLHCHDESVKLIVSAGEHQQQRSRRGSTHSSF